MEKLRFRVIYDLAGRPPWWQMAIDEALLELVSKGVSPPTLRFYIFSPATVLIGLFQAVKHSVRVEEAEKRGVPITRRFTGGGAVYNDEQTLVYSVALPATGALAGIEDSYRVVCTALVRGLRRLGVDAEYVKPNDITVRGRKVSGNAQARRGGALLQHGTLLYDTDLDIMEELLVVPRVKLEHHGARSIRERVVNLSEVLGKNVDLHDIAYALTEGFREVFGANIVEGWYTREEIKLARTLSEKYRDPKWNFKR